ncbi:MAG: peptidoglycan DD-metalloendopeptidase family protein [Dehalococcoidia bacterium]
MSPDPGQRRPRWLDLAGRLNRIESLRWLAERRSPVSHAALVVLVLAAGAFALGRSSDASRSGNLGYLVAPTDQTTEGQSDTNAVAGDDAGDSELREPVAFFTYEVAPGDTLSAIAETYGVSIDYLIWNNPEVGADPDSLIIGENLLIPGTEGLVYDVRLGDTITDIAATYNVDPAAIVEFAPNELVSPDNIIEGMVLVLPGAVPPPPPEPEPLPEPEPGPAPADPPAFGGPLPAGVAVEPVSAPIPSIGYIWPVSGSLNSYYGPRWGSFHKGIDIGAPYGTAIAAAGSGQVVLATYRDNGYGNYIIVRHADGTQTLYAHLSSIWVAQGQYVSQGEGIGAVGCTGWCTGNHLHFEIQINGAAVDPLAYLP